MVKRGLAMAALIVAPAAADALRCQGGLVTPGDHKTEVLAACGEPEFREEVVEYPFRVAQVGGRAQVEYLPLGLLSEEWVYEFGPQRFRQLLRFRNHRLAVIETLSKP